MKIVRIIALVLSICLTVSALSACSLFGSSKLPSTIGDDEKFIFKVVRSSKASDEEEELAKVLRNTMRENFDCKVDIAKDEIEDYDVDAYEVVIGDTNRPESTEAKEILTASRANTAFDFIVKVIGRKVCIQATNDEMITVAGSWFAETFCDSIDDWGQLTTDYEFIYSQKFDIVENKVAGVDLGGFTIVKPLFADYISLMEIEEYINFYENYGYKVIYNDDVDAETTYEILLGNADREASKSVTVEGDNYVIKVVGTKIVIKGGTSLATFRAIRHFNQLVMASKNGGEAINWTDGYVINGKYDANEAGTYTLNWADEFNGRKVDLSYWQGYNGGSQSTSVLGGKLWLYDAGVQHVYEGGPEMPGKMSYITDGKWAFENYRVDKDFFVHSFSTQSSLLWRYGVAEISVQALESPAATSLWFNCAPSSVKMGGEKKLSIGSGSTFTEIDLIENYGNPNAFAANVHRWWTEPSLDGLVNSLSHNVALDESHLDKDSSAGFTISEEKYGADGMGDKTQHVYSWYWDKNQMKFAFDGRRWCTYDYTKANSVTIHSLLTYFIIGGSFGNSTYGVTWKAENGDPDYTIGYVDYCRIYQTDAITSQMIKSYTTEEYERPGVIVYPNHPIVGKY